jgi:hypothetical protein
MKQLTLLFTALLLSASSVFSQTFPDYGIISNEEWEIKECAFDKDANSIMLINEAVADHDDEYHLITEHHIRIKILKDKGIGEANVSLYFYRKDGFEFIDRIEAQVINHEASGEFIKEPVSKKAFYTKNINERVGVVAFAFPSVKVGSIIEYKYRSVMKSYSGLDDWDFQQEMPVVKSKYTLTILPNYEFTYQIKKKTEMAVDVKSESATGKVFFEMHNIPSLTDEAYMDAREDYIQKVKFQLSGYNNYGSKKTYMTSWDEVIKELLDSKEFGAQLGKNLSGTGGFIDAVKILPDEEARMKTVFNYVRSNMSWDNLNSKYALEGVKDPWEKKKGNRGDINLILVNLLKDAGLEVYPALVSERSHGKVETTLPFIDQFNAVFACVQIKDKKYFLDATDMSTPANIIPNDILNTTALIVHRKKGGIINITNDFLEYVDFSNSLMELDNKGKLSGSLYIKSDGYSKVGKTAEYNTIGKEKYVDRYFRKEGVTISDYEMMNLNNDSLQLEQKIKFEIQLPETGDYLYLPLNIFSGFEKNPFISDNRFSNINFGYKRRFNVNQTFKMPEGYSVDALPKNIKMVTPDKDIIFNRSVEYNKETNSVICMYYIDFKKSLYEVDEYEVLKEVYKRMFDFLKEPVVLKKK